LFDTADTLIDTLRIYADMMRGVTVKPDNMRAAVMQGFATATDLADYLVKKGMPFRDSHEVVAQAVRHADEVDYQRRLQRANTRRQLKRAQPLGRHRA